MPVKPLILAFLSLAILFFSAGCDLSFSDDESDVDVNPEQVAEALGVEFGSGWRDGRDVAVLTASNNAVEWETLNVQAPTSPNRPGDAEWIIARVNGSGYSRLLIMTMFTDGGKRSPSRIFLDGPGGGMTDGAFSVPLNGVARWRVESSGGALRIFLNGREIWSASGNFTVSQVTMGDSVPRGFLGQWRPVQ